MKTDQLESEDPSCFTSDDEALQAFKNYSMLLSEVSPS